MSSLIGPGRRTLGFGSERSPIFANPGGKTARTGITAHKAEHDARGAVWSRIYNALWYPALPFALAAAGGDLLSRRERLCGVAVGADALGQGKLRVWVHAASVGEIEGVRPVLQDLTRIRPELEFVITAMTLAGRDAARRRLNGICQLAPLDHAAAVRAFVSRMRPVLVIIAETELWPNFFLQSAAAGARIALINARLSTRSMRRYRLIRPLFARALRSASAVLAQTNEDAERFCRLGALPERVAVTGNAKYEVRGDSPSLRPALAAFADGRPTLIAGSTGPGEEQIVLTAYRDLTKRFPSLALVLAPRHLQRIDEVVCAMRSSSFAYIRASESKAPPVLTADTHDATHGARHGSSNRESPMPAFDQEDARSGSSSDQHVIRTPHIFGEPAGRIHPQVLLLDTMGELGAFYQRAAIAFVGGSLTPGRGGQSLAEPANASVPVLFGPYYENHRQLGDALIAAGAGRVVRNAAQLADACAQWLADDEARSAAGQAARSVMQQLAGSTATTVGYLCALLPAS
jgi:3-deoxy-D-manno-octulosonic-acid transferase